MFADRSDLVVPWDGDLNKLNDRQLDGLVDYLLRQALGDNPTAINAARKQLEAGAPRGHRCRGDGG